MANIHRSKRVNLNILPKNKTAKMNNQIQTYLRRIQKFTELDKEYSQTQVLNI